MKAKLLATLIAGALFVPGLAQAHTSRHELRHDVQRIHKEQRQLARARHNHNWAKARHERRQLAAAKAEYRSDWRHHHRP